MMTTCCCCCSKKSWTKPLLALATFVAFAAGLYFSLYASPADYQQHETVRIMYVHVPAAWVGILLYGLMAIVSGIGLWKKNLKADIFCVAAAPVGTLMVAACLITGSMWGKTTWGAWWVWDARLTSVLILFLLYCGYIVLRSAFDDHEYGSRAGAFLLMIGAVNLPIVYFSVFWWHTLHQPPSIIRQGGPSLPIEMLIPLFVMLLAYTLFAALVVMLRMEKVTIERELEAAALEAEDNA